MGKHPKVMFISFTGFLYSFNFFSVFSEIMLRMGYSLEEIQDSLINQKYNDVMATYLLLDFRNSEVMLLLKISVYL